LKDVPDFKLPPFSYLKLVAHLNIAIILPNNNLTLMIDQSPDLRFGSDLFNHLKRLVKNYKFIVLLAHIDILVVKQQTLCIVCFERPNVLKLRAKDVYHLV
jgi:hypothetical protein